MRPTALYEAGARVEPNGGLAPLLPALDLRRPDVLDRLLDGAAMHYNEWWMFGFPKSLVAAHGMPLPCFIRGDDVEFGLRLHACGVPTVSLPGVGVWHAPFYLKIGGWLRLGVRDLVWFRVQRSEALAVDTYWDRELPTYRRDRAAFRTLLGAGVLAILQVRRDARRLEAAWRQDAPRLTTVGFWRDYVRQGGRQAGR